MSALPTDSIKVGPRSRQDFGDIGALAQSIADIGLLHPIVVTPDGSLIAAARRLMAFKMLGREAIPVTAVDLERVDKSTYYKFQELVLPLAVAAFERLEGAA